MAHAEVSAPLRILLVEDSEHDAVAFHRAFRKAATLCDIALCERAEEALARLYMIKPPHSILSWLITSYRGCPAWSCIANYAPVISLYLSCS